jgi:hypothetical protein
MQSSCILIPNTITSWGVWDRKQKNGEHLGIKWIEYESGITDHTGGWIFIFDSNKILEHIEYHIAGIQIKRAYTGNGDGLGLHFFVSETTDYKASLAKMKMIAQWIVLGMRQQRDLTMKLIEP